MKKTNLSFDEILESGLKNVYWVDCEGEKNLPSEYPGEFEQAFGNISYSGIVFEEVFAHKERLDDIHEFLKENGFDGVYQFNVNKYITGHFINERLRMYVKLSFSSPDIKKDSDDDTVNISYDSVTSCGGVTFGFCPLSKNRHQIEQFLRDFISKSFMFLQIDDEKFYMIAQNQNGLYNQPVKFEPPIIKNDDFDMYYGDNFPHTKMLEFLTNDNTDNLMIIHGPPGTGKSEYLKYLFQFSKRDVIYVPPSMLAIISTPGFVSYITENKGCLVVIEDAEEILSVERNAATQNLLGMCSGLLKDALDIKCICTLNCEIGKIDPALLRKGRLHFEHYFRKLTRQEGERLANFVGIDIKINDDITISEIFNNQETSIENKLDDKRIGFC
jgi:hypothetical protein